MKSSVKIILIFENIFFFEYLELLSEDVRYGSFNEEYYIDYHYIYSSY